MEQIDNVDLQLLNILHDNSKYTVKELVKMVNLAASPVFERIKRLENNGYIKKYIALLDAEKLNRGFIVFCNIKLKQHDRTIGNQFVSDIMKIEEIVECYNISGDYDFLMKVYAKDMKHYQDFVFNACNLFYDDPIAEWKKLSVKQQSIVDHLNKCTKVEYKGNDIDISFSTEGRIWINSDGKTNMPSGEVYTAPVEDSVNGIVRFSHPSIFMGTEVEDIRLEVKDGEVVKWDAKRGKALLDKIMDIPGARRFGEAAVGTNFNIDKFTKNILFDEKIGGTIHMGIGQSYIQTGGKNQSPIHWDGKDVPVDGSFP